MNHIKANWPPTREDIEAAMAQQRIQRDQLSRRVDDGPMTILVPPGRVGPTPRPAIKKLGLWQKLRELFR